MGSANDPIDAIDGLPEHHHSPVLRTSAPQLGTGFITPREKKMKMSKIQGSLLVALLAMSAGPAALAADTGWYGGVNIGQSRATIDNARITASLLGAGFTTTAISNDDLDTGLKVYGGYQINKNFALEGGYFSLGKVGFTATTLPPGSLMGTMKVHGMNLDVVGSLPVSNRFSVSGRVGLTHAQTRDTFVGTGAVNVLTPNPRKNAAGLKVGIGASYQFSPMLAVRVEAERYRVNDAVGNRGDVDLISVGLVYRFGAGWR